jgi:aspartyl-tRNA(Asn)/glutamyl-tRNA(Gln) amidotransferase subunit A
MVSPDPTFLPVHLLSREVMARRLSPVDLVEAYLGRIAQHDPKLQAFVEIYADEARQAAQASDRAAARASRSDPADELPAKPNSTRRAAADRAPSVRNQNWWSLCLHCRR